MAVTRSTPLRYFAAFIGTMIVVMGILDVISTNLVLQAGGRELNPIVALWMKYLDHWWHLPKLAIHLVAAFVVYYLLYTRFTAAIALLALLYESKRNVSRSTR